MEGGGGVEGAGGGVGHIFYCPHFLCVQLQVDKQTNKQTQSCSLLAR